MCTEQRTNLLVSDEGFSVEVRRPDGIEYREGGKSLLVDCEFYVAESKISLVLYPSSTMRWDPPNSASPLTEVTKAKIISNIRSAFRFWGYEIEVQ